MLNRFTCSTDLDGLLNCLKSINSANENIILSFILLSLTVSIIKTFTGLKCVISNGFAWITMLKLHKQNECLKKLFNALLNRKLSTVYQIFKELLDEIARLCQRTKPSKQDTILLKDLPTLVNQIVNHPTFLLKLLKVLWIVKNYRLILSFNFSYDCLIKS